MFAHYEKEKNNTFFTGLLKIFDEIIKSIEECAVLYSQVHLGSHSNSATYSYKLFNHSEPQFPHF